MSFIQRSKTSQQCIQAGRENEQSRGSQHNNQSSSVNANFNYYLYKKGARSQNMLNSLRNSKSAHDLLEREKKRTLRESSQFSNEEQRGKFYQRYKPQVMEMDKYWQTNDYGIKIGQAPKIKWNDIILRNKSPEQLYMYRSSRGMISSRSQKVMSRPNIISDGQSSVKQQNYGLSEYELRNTISGQINSRSGNHLKMGLNKTNKIDNRQKQWYHDYGVSEDQKTRGRLNNTKFKKNYQDLTEARKSKEKQTQLQKIHSFDSDSQHKLFEGKKDSSTYQGFQQSGRVKDLRQQWKTGNHLKMENYSSRSEQLPPLGLQLEYPKANSAEESLKQKTSHSKSKPLLGSSRSQRNLRFTRQIINPQRGCFR